MRVNVEKHFTRINHKILLTKIHHYMDQPSLNLISKFCKVGYIKRDNLTESCQVFEQISHIFILFPLLCNIYFHDFDRFILENLIGVSAIKNFLTVFLGRQEKKGVSLYNPKFPQIFSKFKNFKQFNPNFNKLYYVRYVVNFMFGCTGGKLKANKVYLMIFNYISGTLKFGLYPNEFTVVRSIKYVRYLETMIR